MIRALGLSVLLVLVIAVIVWMRPSSTPKPATPAPSEFAPLVPEKEKPVAADEAFREACFASLKALTAGWTFNDILYTQSDTWGLVLRADYTTPDVEGPNINRVVCSKGTDGKTRVNVTMGQKVPPLAASK